jgi:lipopolysaccharide transport system permease protein
MLARPETEPLSRRSGEATRETAAKEPGHDVWELTPHRGSVARALAEVWRYRRLLRFFGARALERLYARTILGRLWLLIRPLFPVVVGALVFGGLLGVDSDGRPYLLFFLVGSTLWSWFEGCLTWATRSLAQNRKVLRRIYVPRLLLPLAMTAPSLLELGIRLVLVAVAATYYAIVDQTRLAPIARMPLGLIPLALAYGLALGIAMFTSVMAATARDVRFALAYGLSLAMFLSPVVYPLDVVPDDHRWIAALNPMAGLLEAFRFCLIGTGSFDLAALGYAALIAAVLLTFGLRFFVRAEATALDRI